MIAQTEDVKAHKVSITTYMDAATVHIEAATFHMEDATSHNIHVTANIEPETAHRDTATVLTEANRTLNRKSTLNPLSNLLQLPMKKLQSHFSKGGSFGST